MASIQITPDGIGQAGMLAIGALGIAMWFDAYLYARDMGDFFSTFQIAVHIDERLRVAAELVIGLLLVMFAFGQWTVQVGAAAVFLSLAMALGNYWTITSGRGEQKPPQTTVYTGQQQGNAGQLPANRKRCPLVGEKLAWCTQDHDKDGIINKLDDAFNSNGAGRRNCETGYYITSNNKACE